MAPGDTPEALLGAPAWDRSHRSQCGLWWAHHDWVLVAFFSPGFVLLLEFFFFFGCMECGILVPWLGDQTHVPCSEPQDLTTGPQNSPVLLLESNPFLLKILVSCTSKIVHTWHHPSLPFWPHLIYSSPLLAHSAPAQGLPAMPLLSMGFLRQQYWVGCHFLRRDLPNTGIEPSSPVSPTLASGSLSLSHQESPKLEIEELPAHPLFPSLPQACPLHDT